jgi:hypothetical protein
MIVNFKRSAIINVKEEATIPSTSEKEGVTNENILWKKQKSCWHCGPVNFQSVFRPHRPFQKQFDTEGQGRIQYEDLDW